MWLDILNAFKRESKKTTEQISEESGIPKGTLNKLFAGQTKDPQYSTLKAVVNCLGHTVDDLDGTKKTPPSEDRGVTEEEFELVEIYRELNEDGQRAYRAAASGVFSVPEYKKYSDFENGTTVNRDNDVAG